MTRKTEILRVIIKYGVDDVVSALNSFLVQIEEPPLIYPAKKEPEPKPGKPRLVLRPRNSLRPKTANEIGPKSQNKLDWQEQDKMVLLAIREGNWVNNRDIRGLTNLDTKAVSESLKRLSDNLQLKKRGPKNYLRQYAVVE